MLPKRNFLTNNKQTHNFAAVFRVIGTHGAPIRAVAQGDSLNREPTLRKPQKNDTNMKQMKQIAAGEHFTAVDAGEMARLGEYQLPLGPDAELPGKVFGGAAVGATGAEFSFQSFAPGTETGFLHTHRTHEELYFFLSGQGEFQVDGQSFPVGEGSVVRVAPAGRRSVRNTGREPLVMLCIQYRGGTFTAEDATDGDILREPVRW